MSYTVYLLDLGRVVSVAEAGDVVERWDGDGVSRRDSVSGRLDRFLRALDAALPLAVSDDSPWGGFEYYPDGVVLDMVWSAIPHVPTLIEDLAVDHGLAVLNPQGFPQHPDPYLWQAPYLKLDCGMDYPAVNPRPEALDSALNMVLEGEFEYAILNRKSSDYIQLAPGRKGYVIEWQEGGLDNHWQAVGNDVERLKLAFDDFAKGDTAYRTMYDFKKLVL